MSCDVTCWFAPDGENLTLVVVRNPIVYCHVMPQGQSHANSIVPKLPAKVPSFQLKGSQWNT